MELKVNIILLFYAPASTISGINMFANILSIFPSFQVLTDEKKFLYLFQCEEYDIVEVIVRGVSEMLIGEMN